MVVVPDVRYEFTIAIRRPTSFGFGSYSLDINVK